MLPEPSGWVLKMNYVLFFSIDLFHLMTPFPFRLVVLGLKAMLFFGFYIAAGDGLPPLLSTPHIWRH